MTYLTALKTYSGKFPMYSNMLENKVATSQWKQRVQTEREYLSEEIKP